MENIPQSDLSRLLGRNIRNEPLKTLGVPTWNLADEAINSGDVQKALELVALARFELKERHDSIAHILAYAIDFIAQNVGEEQVGKVWETIGKRHIAKMHIFKPYPPEVRVLLAAELQRGHCCGQTGLGDMTIVEEPDRYVLTFNPCGTGGRMRMTENIGRTQKPYPWSWNQVGVPYYCTHCCTMNELMSIDVYGYPIRIYEGGNWRDDPCVRYIYKKPELIPEKYFTRLGKTRRPELFKT